MIIDIMGVIAILTALGVFWWLLRPRNISSEAWRAMATPLASIIGSGFLIAVPILGDLAGQWSIYLMLSLLVFAYMIGGAIRHNILFVEPILEEATQNGRSPLILSLERISELALVFAYFVSVAYYLTLFSIFLLRPFGITDDLIVKILVSGLLLAIGGTGLWRGFAAIERIEIYAVSLKLAVIGGLMVALVANIAQGFLSPDEQLHFVSGHFDMADIPIVMGLLIIVQGFETSRFLGSTYNPQLRVLTMKRAQICASAIYILFFLLVLPLQGATTPDDSVSAIIDILRPVSIVLPLLVIIGALASQSSASIADAIGASGLLNTVSGNRISIRQSFPLIALVAALVTWETNVFSLIMFASRSFAFYYGFQCLVATLSAHRRRELFRMTGFGLLALACFCVTIFGIPSEGG